MSNGRVVWARELTGVIRVEEYESGKVRVWIDGVGAFYTTYELANRLVDSFDERG